MQFQYIIKEKPSKRKKVDNSVREDVFAELNYLASQIKTNSYGDGVAYERDVRKDRPLRFRD